MLFPELIPTPFTLILLKSQYLPLHHRLFDQDAIILKDMPHTVTLDSQKDEKKVTVPSCITSYEISVRQTRDLPMS